jgi:hypothetical protein
MRLDDNETRISGARRADVTARRLPRALTSRSFAPRQIRSPGGTRSLLDLLLALIMFALLTGIYLAASYAIESHVNAVQERQQ